MDDRRSRVWIAALIALGLVTAGAAVGLLWWASALQVQVNHWYTSQTGGEYDVVRGAFYDRLGSNAYAMQTIVSPLLAGTVFATLAALAVLARRWDRRLTGATGQTEAPAAS